MHSPLSPAHTLLRHYPHYTKSAASDVTEAVQQFEQNIAEKSEAQNPRGSDRAVKRGSGASRQFVN